MIQNIYIYQILFFSGALTICITFTRQHSNTTMFLQNSFLDVREQILIEKCHGSFEKKTIIKENVLS